MKTLQLRSRRPATPRCGRGWTCSTGTCASPRFHPCLGPPKCSAVASPSDVTPHDPTVPLAPRARLLPLQHHCTTPRPPAYTKPTRTARDQHARAASPLAALCPPFRCPSSCQRLRARHHPSRPSSHIRTSHLARFPNPGPPPPAASHARFSILAPHSGAAWAGGATSPSRPRCRWTSTESRGQASFVLYVGLAARPRSSVRPRDGSPKMRLPCELPTHPHPPARPRVPALPPASAAPRPSPSVLEASVSPHPHNYVCIHIIIYPHTHTHTRSKDLHSRPAFRLSTVAGAADVSVLTSHHPPHFTIGC